MASKNKPNAELVFLPLGGIGEIGMNLYLYGIGPVHKRDWLMVDLGVTFAGPNEPGIDLIVPDTRFIEEEAASLKAIVLTHAHEDHFGAVLLLWHKFKAPLYATPFTAGLLRAKLIEQGLEDEIPINEIQTGAKIDAGSFQIELIDMAHSIPETSALLIKTHTGTIFHSSDWKLDPNPVAGAQTDIARLEKAGKDGIDILVCDSTNALRDGLSPSEKDVAENLQSIVANAPNRVAITTFASNVARLHSAMRAAQKADRHIVLVGRAMKRVVQVALETGHLPRDFELLSEDDFGYLPRDKVLALCTGSQGETRAAMARIAKGDHPRVNFTKGDTVLFSSRTIPGNEKQVGEVQNGLIDRGIEVVTDNDAMIHVSGHPRRGELEQLYKLLNPRVAIPMHGEARHLEAHADFAKSMGVNRVIACRNGDITKLAPGDPQIHDEAPSGRVFLDGQMLIEEGEGPADERRRLSYAGAVAVSVVVTSKGDLAAPPEITAIGIPQETSDGVSMHQIMLDAATGAFESMPRPRRKDRLTVSEALRRAVRAAVNSHWGKKPPCSVMVTMI